MIANQQAVTSIRVTVLPLLFIVLSACRSIPTAETIAKSSNVPSSAQKLSIMQSVTTSRWTRINLLRPRSKAFEVQFFAQDGLAFPETMVRRYSQEFQASEWVVDGFVVDGINPKGTYEMVVKEGGEVVDRRLFTALDTTKKSYRFALTSCSDDFYKDEQKGMWADLAKQNPDFILMIGDNVYADWKDGKMIEDLSPTTLWNRYVETRNILDLYRLPRLIPVMATWDDHDYGVNDGDRRFKSKHEALVVFHTFFPQAFESDEFARGPAASSFFTVGGQNFALLDGRSFRSPNKVSPVCQSKASHTSCQRKPKDLGPDDAAKKESETHFGSVQEKWLLKRVKKARGPVFLISGDQWFGAYHPFESFEGNHPKNFSKFIKSVRNFNHPVVFLSGDRHISEISKIEKAVLGYETYEIVSSPIHARVFPNAWGDFPNPRQTHQTSGTFNYTLIDSARNDSENPTWDLKVRNIKAGGALGYEHQFSLSLEGE